jgi:hypothetical protein
MQDAQSRSTTQHSLLDHKAIKTISRALIAVRILFHSLIRTITKNSDSQVEAGCSTEAPDGTFNVPFNRAGGGVFAMEWDNQKFIRV